MNRIGSRHEYFLHNLYRLYQLLRNDKIRSLTDSNCMASQCIAFKEAEFLLHFIPTTA